VCPLGVHYGADLQSVHGFRCYDNIHVCKLIALYTANAYSAEREVSASASTRCMADLIDVLGGAVVQRVRLVDLRSVGRGFKSCSRQRYVTTLGKLFTPMCLCHQAV